MGRKILSKRKTSIAKSGPLSGASIRDGAAADVRVGDSLPLEPLEVGKTVHTRRGGLRQSSGPSKKHKQG
jgi:hypothetical protein